MRDGDGEPLTTQFFAIIETGKEPVRVALVPLELLFIRLPPSPNCGERSRAAAAALKLIILYLRLRQSNPAVTRCSPVQTGPQQQQQGQQEHCQKKKDSLQMDIFDIYNIFTTQLPPFVTFVDTLLCCILWIVIGVAVALYFPSVFMASPICPTSCEKIHYNYSSINYSNHINNE